MNVLLNILEFLFLVLINSILPSLILLVALNKFFEFKINGLNITISLIIGQGFNGLILYYFFLFIPKLETIIYVSIICLSHLILIYFFRNEFKKLFLNSKDQLKNIKEEKYKLFQVVKSNPIFILVSFYILFGIILLIFRPLSNHDTILYALHGNGLTYTKTIEYNPIVFFSNVNLEKHSMHAYGFSIFKVIENFFNFNDINSDLYYRFISVVNGLYLILILYLFVKNNFNKFLGFYSSLLLSVSGIFIFIIANYGTGTITYSYFLISVIFLFEYIQGKKVINITLLGVSVGLGSFYHSINFLILPMFILTILLANKEKLKLKILKSIWIVFISLLFGSIHYILEIIMGNGWVLGNKFHHFRALGKFIERIF